MKTKAEFYKRYKVDMKQFKNSKVEYYQDLIEQNAAIERAWTKRGSKSLTRNGASYLYVTAKGELLTISRWYAEYKSDYADGWWIINGDDWYSDQIPTLREIRNHCLEAS